jgi:hypothetical protein
MKWILIIAQLGYSSSSGTTSLVIPQVSSTISGNTIVVPPSKERSQTMDRDSCFKAAETVKKAFPAAEVSCEVVQ